MKRRLPIVLSVTALVIAVAGTTPLGEAASDAIPRFARNAGNADKVDGLHASRTPKAGRLLALNRSRKFPASVFPSTPLSGLEIAAASTATDSSSPKVVVVNCPTGKRVVGGAARATGTAVNNGNVAVTESFASTASQWTVRALETTAAGASWALGAQAFCAAGTSP
jgi:hypothetical protein